MSDVTPEILPKMNAYRLPGLELDASFIHPDYQGGSILNLPSSISQALGAPPLATPPLYPDRLVPASNGIRRVILLLVDALALHRLQRWMADGTAPVWKRLLEEEMRSSLNPRLENTRGAGGEHGTSNPRGKLSAITSIIPSTTAAALTSLWTGKSPAEHGVVGYELWLKEYGVVSNMILHAPINFEGDVGSLAKAGFRPELFLNLPTLGTHLAAHRVKTYALQHRSIAHSGLSQMFFKDVQSHGYMSSTELWVTLRHLVEANPQERQYFWVYNGQIDHFSHFYHPDDERTEAEFAEFSYTFEQQFLNRLSPAVRQGTLILLTADHGMLATRKSPTFDLRHHPDLTRLLPILPTGEHRFMYFFIKPGKVEQVKAYITRTWPGKFSFIDPAEAVNKGLFGPGSPHPRLADRIGDLIVAAREDAYLWWAEKENPLIGQHGGLVAEEMVVPLLSVML